MDKITLDKVAIAFIVYLCARMDPYGYICNGSVRLV